MFSVYKISGFRAVSLDRNKIYLFNEPQDRVLLSDEELVRNTNVEYKTV